MQDRWFHLPLNPEPWAIGSIGIGKRGGKIHPTMSPNPQLVTYKEAIKEELGKVQPLPEGEYDLYFWFWRVLDSYTLASGRDSRRKQADATNLQKATEDALQGLLIGNDRNVRKIGSEIVEQGPEVKAGIVIRARPWEGHNPDEIPSHVWDLVDGTVSDQIDYGDWTSGEGMF